MRRTCVIAAALLVSGGCRSIGQYPGIAQTELAYTYWWGTAAQVFPFPLEKTATSVRQALLDLGFTQVVSSRVEGDLVFEALTIDHRKAKVVLGPRNVMTEVRVKIGYVGEGDETLSVALLQRIALNFGTLPPQLVPLEPTLARRHDEVLPPPESGLAEIPEPLPVPQPLERRTGSGNSSSADDRAPTAPAGAAPRIPFALPPGIDAIDRDTPVEDGDGRAPASVPA